MKELFQWMSLKVRAFLPLKVQALKLCLMIPNTVVVRKSRKWRFCNIGGEDLKKRKHERKLHDSNMRIILLKRKKSVYETFFPGLLFRATLNRFCKTIEQPENKYKIEWLIFISISVKWHSSVIWQLQLLSNKVLISKEVTHEEKRFHSN